MRVVSKVSDLGEGDGGGGGAGGFSKIYFSWWLGEGDGVVDRVARVGSGVGHGEAGPC